MKLQIGKLTLILSWNKTFITTPVVVLQDEYIKVKKPVLIEEIVEVPRAVVSFIDHQVVIPNYKTIEKIVSLKVERPVVEEVEKKITIEHPTYEDRDIVVPRYHLAYDESKAVKVDSSMIFDVNCPCGTKYPSNMTKCVKCGRKTIDALKEG